MAAEAIALTGGAGLAGSSFMATGAMLGRGVLAIGAAATAPEALAAGAVVGGGYLAYKGYQWYNQPGPTAQPVEPKITVDPDAKPVHGGESEHLDPSDTSMVPGVGIVDKNGVPQDPAMREIYDQEQAASASKMDAAPATDAKADAAASPEAKTDADASTAKMDAAEEDNAKTAAPPKTACKTCNGKKKKKKAATAAQPRRRRPPQTAERAQPRAPPPPRPARCPPSSARSRARS